MQTTVIVIENRQELLAFLGMRARRAVRKLLPLLLTLALSSCDTVEFTRYSGPQLNWPTQPGSFVTDKYAIPAYLSGLPDSPYALIGYVDTVAYSSSGSLAVAAREAKQMGADAIVLVRQGQQYGGTIGSSYTFFSGMMATTTTLSARLTGRPRGFWPSNGCDNCGGEIESSETIVFWRA
jgi:hypothetical protein